MQLTSYSRSSRNVSYAHLLRHSGAALLMALPLAGCSGSSAPCPAQPLADASSPTASSQTATAASSSHANAATTSAVPPHDGAAFGRGVLRDRNGEALSFASQSQTPTSLRPWVGELNAKGHSSGGLQAHFDAQLSTGTEVTSSLDAKMHRQLEHAFAGVERGAGVVINLADGSLRALFSTLPHNGTTGLAKRHLATSRATASGSTAKPFTAVAALSSGIITAETHHTCTGSERIGPRVYRCFGTHGDVDLARALAISDNAFFYHAARRLDHNTLADTQRGFGLGVANTILPNAAMGAVRRQGYFEVDGRKMSRGHTINQSIGHGTMAVTPLQLARAYATLASGTLPTLTFSPGKAASTTALKAAWLKQLPMIRHMLKGTVNKAEGTAHFPGPAADVAGKTGTAHGIKHSSDQDDVLQGWFAGWAPAEAPQIAFAFRVEGYTGRQTAKHVLAAIAQMKLSKATADMP